MGYARKNRKYFTRNAKAARYRNVEAMMADDRFNYLSKELVTLPAAGSIRPIAFGVYDEASSDFDFQTNVICSGTPILIGAASGGGIRIGITASDGVVGQKVTAYTSGKFFLPLDWAGDAGASPARIKASDPGALAGKVAYYLKDLGLVTDQLPAAAGSYLQIGTFVDHGTLRTPENLYGWHSFGLVDLVYVPNQTAVTLPTAAAIAHTGSVTVFPTVSTFGGLTVDFYINAVNSDPWTEYLDADVSTLLSGATTKTGRIFSHTFATAATHTVAITVGGTTFNYQVVTSATLPPVLSAV